MTFSSYQEMRRGVARWCPFFWVKKKKKTLVWGRLKLIILMSYILEVISQPPYSHYMDPVSYDFTNDFGKMPYLVALLTHLLTTGRDGQKQNREGTKGHSRWKAEQRHGKFEEFGLNNLSISKSQNGGRNQVSGRVSVPCWHATEILYMVMLVA